MKKFYSFILSNIILYSSLILAIDAKADYCTLDLNVAKFKNDNYQNVTFTIISDDNKFQQVVSKLPQDSHAVIGVMCGKSYSIYAQLIDPKTTSISDPDTSSECKALFGDYTYIINPLYVTGSLPIYFPSRFKIQ